MSVAIYDLVKDRVSALDAARFYGMEFGRNRRAVCPWHADKNPDLAFYDDGARCYCHACHAGGDAIALVGQLFGLRSFQAAQKINDDFRLGCDVNQSSPKVSAKRRTDRRRELESWRRQRYSALCEVERTMKRTCEAASGWDSLHFLENLKALAMVQDSLELLHIADLDELEAMKAEGRLSSLIRINATKKAP